MGRISPYEEERMAHSYHNYSAIGFLALSIALVPLLYTAYDHRRFSVHIVAQNFGWVFDVSVAAGRSWDVSIDEVNFRHWDGAFEYNQLAFEKYSPEEQHRVINNPWASYKYLEMIKDPKKHTHRIAAPQIQGRNATFLRNKYKVMFGMTDTNKCNYNPSGRPSGLPSILRTFELSCSAQLIVRTIVLATFYVRWYYTYLRCIPVFNNKKGFLHRSLAFLTPKLQFIESFFAFLLTCLQQDNDRPLLWLFPTVVIGWAVSLCLYILSFTLMSLIDGSGESSSRLAQIRFACICIVVSCCPVWIQNHLPFIRMKTCFTEVPVREALSEYVTVLAVIVFVITQLYEMRNYWGLLSCSDHDYLVEVNSEFDEKYRPSELEVRPAATRNRLSSSSARKSSDVSLVGAMSGCCERIVRSTQKGDCCVC